jgi:hypothetical protein
MRVTVPLFHLASYGASMAHKKVMTDESVLYGEATTQSTLQHGERGMSYNSFYMPSLAYDTPSTSLTVKECTDLQKLVVITKFTNMGLDRTAVHTVMTDLDWITWNQSRGMDSYMI